MTPLKEQTVYIPTGHKLWKGKFSIHSDDNSHAQFVNESNQICLSKEELIELIGKTWDASNDRRLCESLKEKGISPFVHHPSKEDFINNILNQ